jgi:hypothetical protein
MGGGALIQLIALGNQNIIISGNPQITYFKSIYRRYTNFAMESIQQDITGNLLPGNRVTVNIARNGDLLKGLCMHYNPSKIVPIQNPINMVATHLGDCLMESMEIEIGGQIIDRHYSLWMSIWDHLSKIPLNASYQFWAASDGTEAPIYSNYCKSSYNHLAWDVLTAITYGQLGIPYEFTGPAGTSNAPTEAYVPLKFWFCRNPGLALPLIALQYHEVKLNITLCTKESIISTYSPTYDYSLLNVDFTSIKIFAEYIYLDSSERKMFAENTHEYLIDQLQRQEYDDNIVSNNTVTIDLNLKHPVKELIFCGKPKNTGLHYLPGITGAYSEINFGPATPNGIVFRPSTTSPVYPYFGTNVGDWLAGDVTPVKMYLTFNQLPRFSPRNLKYFTRCQIWDHHTNHGSLLNQDCIGVYSFALRPEEHQPSGTANFSRITNPRMVFSDFDNTIGEKLNPLTIFAVNYNVLRIMSGMGSVVFAN